MLVLTRRFEESITITGPDGSEIEITQLQAEHGKSRLGIVAPADFKILRKELRAYEPAGMPRVAAVTEEQGPLLTRAKGRAGRGGTASQTGPRVVLESRAA